MTSSSLPVALVTGANRGIGREVARQLAGHGYHVVMGSREITAGQQAVKALQEQGVSNVSAQQIDVTSDTSVNAALDSVRADHGRLDLLVNNAAISIPDSFVDGSIEAARNTFETNLLGAWRVSQAAIPLLREAPQPRIVNVSSEFGSSADLESKGLGAAPYCVSKAALNSLTQVMAVELRDAKVQVNAVDPGWTATEMGGSNAPRSISEGAQSIVATALVEPGVSGGFFRDGKALPF